MELQSITIEVPGEEFETINVSLSAEEVRALYQLRKDQAAKIVELEKKVTSSEQSQKWANDRCTAAESELSQANTLLTALGIQEKTNEEESYSRKALTVATRIALYIASLRG